ncbi:transmembrane protein 26 [Conger conger]|uniref:transmembrane protein 26 n=1 Tax=Conger conger TaxID=82655 RepID=UPI002A5A70C9|nr:transmembrane protein 26 [Conger conger]
MEILNGLAALLSRLLFAVHGLVTVHQVVLVKVEPLYWLLLTGVALLAVEMAVTLKCPGKAEREWFSPVVFLYLSTVVPSIWFLELNLLQSNASNVDPNLHLPRKFLLITNTSLMSPTHEDWAEGLEQTTLIVLVLGRWLMPKGEMTRDELSQLLMMYVGLGADILDIFDTFRQPKVKVKRNVILVGLSLFTWAFMQFPLALTQTGDSKSKDQPESDRSPPEDWRTTYFSSEVLNLLLVIVLQDGPFLVFRLYLMLHVTVLNQLMLFFTCKNILVVLLEFYRIQVIWKKNSSAARRGERRSEPSAIDCMRCLLA